MQLLVLSDSHRNIDRMQYAALQTKPDVILHLGDHIADAYELRRRLPDSMIHMVKGNCDEHSVAETEFLLTFAGVKVYMTHGHLCGVKTGLDNLIKRARQQGADLALFGHTHQAMIQQTQGLWLMNPGQMERHDDGRAASYGMVTIEDGALDCQITFLPL